MDLVLIFLVFSVPLMAVSIFAFLQNQNRRKNWLKGAVFVLNIFFSSVGPLVISILLLLKGSLPTLIAAVTMAGFIPAAASLLLWYAMSKKSPGLTAEINSISFTLLNIGLPISLALLSRSDLSGCFIEIFSYEFLAMAAGVTAGFASSPLTRLLDKKHILLGILFLTAVLIVPGIFYEWRWLAGWIEFRPPDFSTLRIGGLLFRYVGISGLGWFIFHSLKKSNSSKNERY